MEPYDRTIDLTKPRRPRRRWLKRLGWSLLSLLILGFGAQRWSHYQAQKRLDEALAEMDRAEPGWRLKEIEAAREQIPEDENSARVIVAAAALLPKQWPSPEFTERFEHLPPQEQLAAADFARLKEELEKVRPALEKARKVADMPRGRHRIAYLRNPWDTLLTDQDESRRIYRLLILDALRWDQERDAKNALISCRAVLNTARSLGDEPLSVSQLIRTAGVVQACQAAERALAQGEPPATEMIALQKLLEKEDDFPDLLTAARGDRAFDHETFDAFESGDVPIGSLSGGKRDWDERLFGFLYRDNLRDEHPIMLAMMNRWINIAQMPPGEQAEAEQQIDLEARSLPKSAVLSRLFLPAIKKIGESSRRKHACIRCIIVALAAERSRQEKGKWPKSLDQLCPAYLIRLPLDSYDGASLRYRRLDDGIVIYAVGNDGIDNGGNIDWEHVMDAGVDVGYRLWDVAKRHQPAMPKSPPH